MPRTKRATHWTAPRTSRAQSTSRAAAAMTSTGITTNSTMLLLYASRRLTVYRPYAR